MDSPNQAEQHQTRAHPCLQGPGPRGTSDSHFLWADSFQDKAELCISSMGASTEVSAQIHLYACWENLLLGNPLLMKPGGSALGNSKAHSLSFPYIRRSSLVQNTACILLSIKHGLCSNCLTKYFILFYYCSPDSVFGQSLGLVWGLTLWPRCRFSLSKTGLGLWQEDRMGYRKLKPTALPRISWWILSIAPSHNPLPFSIVLYISIY